MNTMHADASRRTPAMAFDAGKGVFEVKGRSIPENAFKFYQPYLEWVRQYLAQEPQQITRLCVSLEYCNSSSRRFLLDIFKMLDASVSPKHKVFIEWHYADNDEDLMELGQELASLLANTYTELISYQRDQPIF